jgi:nitrogen-specific signal transduction histidine kinase
MAHDVTEQKQLEAQLLRSQRLESLGTLAGGIAHDLNNVLTPIGLGVDLLQRAADPGQQQSVLTALRAGVERGAGLIRQILTFARGKEGERRPLPLRQVVLETTEILRYTLPKSIRIEAEMPSGLWDVIGDATQLNQVVLNLCVNARDAMPQGGRLALTAANVVLDGEAARKHVKASAGRYVLLTVADSGTGIAPEVLDKIFDPFFTTKAVGQGTGLGLSTVLGIVQGHGGFVDVETEVGRGSRFHVYLPAAEGAGLAEGRGEERPAPGGRGELVLVADDELSIREMASAALETFGYRALCAADGAEAVALYARRQAEIALAVVDMMMPVMDGPATIRALRTINPRVRLIAASGLWTPPAEAPADDPTPPFLAKPYSARQLLDALRVALA